MIKRRILNIAFVMAFALTVTTQSVLSEPAVSAPKAPKPHPTTINYGTIPLHGSSLDAFPDLWDLTACDLTLSATVDLRDMLDSPKPEEHAWPELGIRQSTSSGFNPPGGIWLVTDYVYPASKPDATDPVYDRDDKIHLQNVKDGSVNDYDLPPELTDPDDDNSYRVWFDRDGVEPDVEANPLFFNGKTHNTDGVYRVDMRFHATSADKGESYLSINGLAQGFEGDDGDPTTMEYAPAGLTFTGDMENMQIFYALIVGTAGSDNQVTYGKVKAKGCLNLDAP